MGNTRIAGLILAAGRSQRMGPINKLLIDIDGVPLIVRVVDAVRHSSAAPVVVVVGHDKERLEETLGVYPISIVHNHEYHLGLSSSLRRGLVALPHDIDGVLVCLGDMPRLKPDHIEQLIKAFDPHKRTICVPMFQGRRGHPVLWDRQYFGDLQTLTGDVGARRLLTQYASRVHYLEMADPGVLIDIDSPAALRAAIGDSY